jgi:hypothetical protein
MFTKAYWDTEIAALSKIWEGDVTPEQAGLLMRGLCFMAGCTARLTEDEQFKKDTIDTLRLFLNKAGARFGLPWYVKNIRVINNHVLPCGGVGVCPCAAFRKNTMPV